MTVATCFTDFDRATAMSQGWDIFDTDGVFLIQRDDELGSFKDDEEAMNFVITKASTGSRLHLLALWLDGRAVDDNTIVPELLIRT